MINVNNLKPGITFEFSNNIFVVISSSHSKHGRGQATVKAKVKNLRTGSIIFKTWVGGEKVKSAHIEKVKANFLYSTDDSFFFMDITSYEQIEISSEKLEWEKNFLVEGSEVKIRKFNDEILDVELLSNVSLLIDKTVDVVKGNTQVNPLKNAVLETGYEIEVPMFIKKGDIVNVSTETGKYVERVKK